MKAVLRPIRIVLAEDHLIVREGLRRLLENESDIRVVGEASNGQETVKLTLDIQPDVVVMDIAMPKLNGIEAARQIQKAAPNIRILVLSAHCDESYVERAMEIGASGFLVKQSSAQDLAKAIRALHKGDRYYSPAILRKIALQQKTTLNRKGQANKAITHLTTREVEVLQLVAEGKANKQVAADLGISIKTVEKHRDHVMQKLGIHDTAGLTRYAIEAGVIECSVQVTIEN
jgi:DNA-binding NarL/FixJ family response regulator